MPCKLSNARYKECCCTNGDYCTLPSKLNYPKKKLLTRAVEGFYENCAAYNLRYIPYRTVTDRNTCLRNTAKDFILLFCFLAANSVVLLTILAKMAMHMSGVILATLSWMKTMLERCIVYANSMRRPNKKSLLALIYAEQVPVGGANAQNGNALPACAQ